MEPHSQSEKQEIELALDASRAVLGKVHTEFDRTVEANFKVNKVSITRVASGLLEDNAIGYQALLDRYVKHPSAVRAPGGIPVKMTL